MLKASVPLANRQHMVWQSHFFNQITFQNRIFEWPDKASNTMNRNLIFYFTLSAVVLYTFPLKAQTGQIRGKMVDSQSREELPFGNVFINNTTLGTAADSHGDFLLKDVPYGQVELVFSYVGYKPAQRKVVVDKETTDLGTVYVMAQKEELATVEVSARRDKEWERQLEDFKKVFLGEDDMARSCTILNPWVINFSQSGNTLLAKSESPVEISNAGLGYKVIFYLNNFLSNNKGYTIQGPAQFIEMITGDGEQAFTWSANRQDTYLGSSRHLFKAIIENRIAGEGFQLYTDKPFAEDINVRSPFFKSELGKKVIPFDTTGIMRAPTKEGGRYIISFNGTVEVHYRGKRALIRTYRDIAYPVSWLEIRGGNLGVDKEGNPFNPADVIVSGDMDADRVARMLPLNYQPPRIHLPAKEKEPLTVSRLRERVYLHTDKPYYYKGETIWFKGYMNYAEPTLADSLSKVLYAELINKEGVLVSSGMFPIQSGSVQGEIGLANNLEAGAYYLRAYTQWMRNFGDSDFFVQEIQVLNITDKVVGYEKADALSAKARRVHIETDQPEYSTRQRVGLVIRVVDDRGKPIASSLSVAVTDMRQVVPVADHINIIDSYPFQQTGEGTKPVSEFPIERGITFKGKFSNDGGKPERATLTLIEWQSREMILTETDKNGIFSLTGLHFYDSALFSFHAKSSRILSESQSFEYGLASSKTKPYGKVEVLPRTMPEFTFRGTTSRITVSNTETPQRLIADYTEQEGTTMLQGIDVKGKREPDNTGSRTLGGADYVITAKELNAKVYANLWLSLAGKAPGLIMTTDAEDQPVVRIARASGLTRFATTEPLVLIDNMPASGTAGDVLKRIDAATVDRVEISSGLNKLYGSQAVNGVIAIYTNSGVDRPADNRKKSKPLQLIAAPGYTRPATFFSPDYGQPDQPDQADYRSTIYWNADVTTGEKAATLWFYTADLATEYRVVVEGVDEFNEPVRGEYIFNVKSN